jgi:hypothetical protein
VVLGLDVGQHFGEEYASGEAAAAKLVALAAFAVLAAVLAWIGSRPGPVEVDRH